MHVHGTYEDEPCLMSCLPPKDGIKSTSSLAIIKANHRLPIPSPTSYQQPCLSTYSAHPSDRASLLSLEVS